MTGKRVLQIVTSVFLIISSYLYSDVFLREPSGQADVAVFETCKSYPELNKRLFDKIKVKYDYFLIDSLGKIPLSGYNIVVIGESWGQSYPLSPVRESGEKLAEFVADGGRVLGLKVPMTHNCWLPSCLKVENKWQQLVMPVILDKNHAIFNTPNDISSLKFQFYKPPMEYEINVLTELCWHGSIVNPFVNLNGNWKPLVSGLFLSDNIRADFDGYGIIEADYKKGKIILCEMIPVFTAVERGGDNGRKLIENIIHYLGGKQ